MIKRINHIAIAVKNLNEALALYEKLFGVKAVHIEDIPEQGVKAAMIPIGEDGEIELLEPLTPTAGVAKFIETKGEGIHHICFEVDDVNKSLTEVANRGAQLIDKVGRKGLAGKIGFIHPKSVKGVLVELAQKV